MVCHVKEGFKVGLNEMLLIEIYTKIRNKNKINNMPWPGRYAFTDYMLYIHENI